MQAPRKRSKRRRRTRTLAHARLGQHFFTSGSVARRIIRSIDLQKNQTVLELGAGEGFFTNLIAPEVKSVTAIDIDPQLISRLNARFKDTENVRVVRKSITSTIEFGDYDVVFGNIPFNRTANIFRKISRPPVKFESCHLIVQTEAAYRLLGSGRPTELAVLAFPFIDVQLGMKVPRWAYDPQTSVDSVVLHVRTRQTPLISRQKYPAFRTFVKAIFKSDIRKLSRVVGGDFSYSRWRRICARLNINPSDSHLALNMRQYVGLFDAINAHSQGVARDSSG
ncbi:MAG: methyltransferase domain-containing protein [Chloroflexi bacterium]|nr:methyltransferase domain-containing protein [Chloroflexota bacterium]MCH8911887.1 methyltransferase domain-containing protein [Chloroflexota bacterium]